jgi:ribosome-binding factor A
MKAFQRSDRVGGEIRKVLSDILRREIKDPRLEMAVITGVKMARDLKSARVYFTVNGDAQDKEQAMNAFKSAHGFVKRALGGRLGLRYMPELKFYHDDSFDYGSHIDDILRSLKNGNGSDHTTPEEL